jgi:hypothetical protein
MSVGERAALPLALVRNVLAPFCNLWHVRDEAVYRKYVSQITLEVEWSLELLAELEATWIRLSAWVEIAICVLVRLLFQRFCARTVVPTIKCGIIGGMTPAFNSHKLLVRRLVLRSGQSHQNR